MKIIQHQDKLISNFEAYQHVVSIQKKNDWGLTIPPPEKKRRGKFNPQLLDLEIITRDLSQYLVKVNQTNESTQESFVGLMLVLNTYEIEVIEKLMIMNLLPRSLVNLYAIIEECEDRFTQEQCEDILANVEKFYPAPQVDDEEAEGQEEMDVDEEEQVEEEQEEEDEEAFVQDDGLEHEGYVKKNQDKEIDEVDS